MALLLLIILCLAFAILFPGDLTLLGRRVMRVVAASLSFSLGMGLSAVIADPGGGDGAGLPFLAMMIGSVIAFPLHLIPFALADQLARVLGARRRPIWALAATVSGIAWAAAVLFLIIGIEEDAVFGFETILALVLPAVVAGLVWFLMLVDQREHVSGIFE